MSKYDIPYAMKPKDNKGKSKKGTKSKYSKYYDDQDTFINRNLSPQMKKLLIYILCFSIFATIFLTALRQSRESKFVSYEIDHNLDYPDSREKNLIESSINSKKNDLSSNNNNKHKDHSVDDEIDEIDILDSDYGEIALSNKENNKSKSKSKNKKGKGKGKEKEKLTKDSFDDELDELINTGNEKLNVKSNSNSNSKKDLVKDMEKLENEHKPKKNKNAFKGEY